MKKRIGRLFHYILVLSVMLLLCSCNKSMKENDSDFFVYSIDKEGNTLSAQPYQPKENQEEKLIQELLGQLKQEENNKQDVPAIPEDIVINGYSITDGIVTIDFNEPYQQLKMEREILCRAAVVLTLTQVKSVEYVAFTINDSPYKRSDGAFVGAMQASDFVSDLGGGNNTNATEDFKIYFANEDASALKEYNLMDAKYGEKSKEQFIVEQLIKGPQKKGYTPTLSPKLKLTNIVTANNICYVDFEQNFLTEQSKVSNQLVIYSIVNSLSELNEIHTVQISVNGDSALKYHDDISLSEPFSRNLDLLEGQSSIQIKEEQEYVGVMDMEQYDESILTD